MYRALLGSRSDAHTALRPVLTPHAPAWLGRMHAPRHPESERELACAWLCQPRFKLAHNCLARMSGWLTDERGGGGQCNDSGPLLGDATGFLRGGPCTQWAPGLQLGVETRSAPFAPHTTESLSSKAGYQSPIAGARRSLSGPPPPSSVSRTVLQPPEGTKLMSPLLSHHRRAHTKFGPYPLRTKLHKPANRPHEATPHLTPSRTN